MGKRGKQEWKSYADGLRPFDSIARELGVAYSTVLTDYKRALRKLKYKPEMRALFKEALRNTGEK